jgi:hypothetical protein
VAVNLALLAGQTPAGPGGDVAGKTALVDLFGYKCASKVIGCHRNRHKFTYEHGHRHDMHTDMTWT